MQHYRVRQVSRRCKRRTRQKAGGRIQIDAWDGRGSRWKIMDLDPAIL